MNQRYDSYCKGIDSTCFVEERGDADNFSIRRRDRGPLGDF